MRYICTSIVATLVLAGTVHSQPVQWTVAEGGNGHWYAVIDGSDETWFEHRDRALAMGGDLACVANESENEFIHDVQIGSGHCGGYVSLGGLQVQGKDEPAGGWYWVSGEPWSYTNWHPGGEPTDSGGGEWALVFHTADGCLGVWNDVDPEELSSGRAMAIEWSADCNGDGIVDYGQILDGTFQDTNDNGVLDDCEQGACCHEGKCDELMIVDCTSLGGAFLGEQTTCDQVSCDGTWVVAQDGSGNFDSVQDAIDAADDGDVVIVMPGHYFENITFLGKAITVQSAAPTDPELTIIDSGNTPDSTTVIFAAGEDEYSILDGFVITGGDNLLHGGGIYCNSRPTIRNCIVRGNHADGNGGGVYIIGSPTFDTCTIHDNDADGLGNGMYINRGTANIIDCVFGASSLGIGEAVYAYGSGAHFTGTTLNVGIGTESGATLNLCSTTWTNSNIENCSPGLIITNSIADQFLGCTFSDNAANYGGGVYCEGGVTGAPVLDECIFDNNTADVDGGGIYCTGSSPTISGCTITGNTVGNGGGGIYCRDSSPAITDCTISSNTATEGGGGIFCDQSSLTLTDCTFTGNTAIDGGGMQSINSMLTLTGCTFINNTVTSEGGGMVAKGSNSGSTLAGCTFENNTANFGGGMRNYMNSNITLTNCIFTNNTATHGGGMSNDNGSSLTVENCSFTGNTATDHGGGIHCLGSTPTITDCTISGNEASNDGGGLYCWSSSPAMENCEIIDNTAGREAGGIYCGSNSNPTITACTINSNTAVSGGGGMFNDGSSPTLADCTFESNASTNYYGGGMFNNSSSSPTLTNCAFTGNIAAGDAGGMYNYSGSNAILTSCNFTDNIAGYAGGMRISDSSPTLIDCTFTGNTASVEGGGVWCSTNSSPVFTECAFESNSATSHGGGLFVMNSTPILTNCLIANNTAGGDGGGIHNSDGGNLVLENCAFTGNQGVLGGGMYNGNDSSQEVVNLTFTENTATRGGGIYVADTNVDSMIDSCTFVGNIATTDGGGLFSTATSCEVADSTFESNAAAQGAGLFLEEGSILRSELKGNIASVAGGGLYSASAAGIYLQDSLICENEPGPSWVEGPWIDGTDNCFPAYCPPSCLGDYDNDGDVNVVDLLRVVGDWGPCGTGACCLGDFNGDGVVGVNDVLIVISAWGPCP